MRDIENLTKDDIMTLTPEEKEEVIKQGVEVYIQQVELGALLLEMDFVSLLETNIINTKKQINNLIEDEEYELCFFLQEVLERVIEKRNGL